MTRLEAHTTSTANRQTGSRASAVLNGQGRVDIGDQTFSLEPGDIFVVPSWTRHQLHANARLDLFTCSDAPVLEVLSLFRSEIIKSA
jgi:gentisate 1,2-dioxygenase